MKPRARRLTWRRLGYSSVTGMGGAVIRQHGNQAAIGQ